MRRAVILACFIAVCSFERAQAGFIHGSVYLAPLEESSFTSWGSATYHNDLGAEDTTAQLSGTHSVNGGTTTFQHAVTGNGTYSYALQGPTAPGTCYSTSLHVVADPQGWFNEIEQTFEGPETKCTPPSSGSTIDVVADKCDGQSGYGQPCSPIVINLAEGAFALSGPDDPVSFDITGDGWPNRITWTAAGSSLAFLARDRNANGRIDDGRELFGDRTVLSNGQQAANGFEALGELDANADGVVDGRDPDWPSLLLWVDGNHDGVSQAQELQAVTASGVLAFRTGYHWTGRRDRAGNTVRYQSVVQTARGTRPVYDVDFIEVQ
jgi:hypothetical protein